VTHTVEGRTVTQPTRITGATADLLQTLGAARPLAIA
jgi:hypothetical protein